jgi:hypothetical protein
MNFIEQNRISLSLKLNKGLYLLHWQLLTFLQVNLIETLMLFLLILVIVDNRYLFWREFKD